MTRRYSELRTAFVAGKCISAAINCGAIPIERVADDQRELPTRRSSLDG
ncbi:hypothetical protein [Natronorubrum sp. FCH18a]